jgi:hypothetical protein
MTSRFPTNTSTNNNQLNPLNSFRTTQNRPPVKELKYDFIQRVYYYKVTTFIGNFPVVTYEDLSGRKFNPSIRDPVQMVNNNTSQIDRLNLQNQSNNIPHQNTSSQKPVEHKKQEEVKEIAKSNSVDELLPLEPLPQTKPSEKPVEQKKQEKVQQVTKPNPVDELLPLEPLPQTKPSEKNNDEKNETQQNQSSSSSDIHSKKSDEQKKTPVTNSIEDDLMLLEDLNQINSDEDQESGSSSDSSSDLSNVENNMTKEKNKDLLSDVDQLLDLIPLEETSENKPKKNKQEKSSEEKPAEPKDSSSLDDLLPLEPLPSPNKKPEEVPEQPSKPNPPSSSEERYEKLKGFYFIKQNIIDLLRALQYGPVVVAHFVSEPFKFYSSGVFNGDGCEEGQLEYVNHASVIVGYDLDAPVPYFKFRNSWADDWGEEGYYRIQIGELSRRNKGLCLFAGTPFMVMPFV